MPGRPKKNDRRREEGEAPKGKKMSRVGIVIKCGFCDDTGHNKSGCKKNPERGKKKNAYLAKSGNKVKQTEQAQTDGARVAANTFTPASSFSAPAVTTRNQFKPPRTAAPKAPRSTPAPTRTSPRKAAQAAASATRRARPPPTRTSPRKTAAVSTSNQQAHVPTRGRKRSLDGRMKEYLTASENY